MRLYHCADIYLEHGCIHEPPKMSETEGIRELARFKADSGYFHGKELRNAPLVKEKT